MTIRKPFVWRGLVDLSWNRYNLYNLYKYSRQGPEREINKTAFQLRWRAKQLCTAYHAGHITQHQFLKQRQSTLPRIQRRSNENDSNNDSDRASHLPLPFPPTTMLAFAFLERRVDMVLFRSCFTTSIWESRNLCNTGDVWVNGQRVRTPGYVLEDGDIIQVNPNRLRLLNPARSQPALQSPSDTDTAAEEGQDAAEEERMGDADGESDDRQKSQSKRVPIMADRDHGLHPVPFMAPWLFVPDYLEVNYRNLTVCFLRSPTIKPGRCEVPSPFDELQHQRAYDYFTSYSRRVEPRQPQRSAATERMMLMAQ